VSGTYAPMAPRGRPPQDGTTRDRMVRFRASSEQEAAWKLAAQLDGADDLSAWLRDLADERAAKVLAGDLAGDRDR
jgi:hypothetical protein